MAERRVKRLARRLGLRGETQPLCWGTFFGRYIKSVRIHFKLNGNDRTVVSTVASQLEDVLVKSYSGALSVWSHMIYSSLLKGRYYVFSWHIW